MKKLFILITVCLATRASLAQTDLGVKAFLRENIGEKDIIYLNYVNSPTVNIMLRSLALDSAGKKDSYYLDNARKLGLTAAEKSYLATEIKKLKDLIWDKDIFKNGKPLSADTINSIFSGKGDGWDYFYAHYGKKYHTFTKPIFLRNKTLCFFYKSYGCGWRCGEGWFAVYEKKNGIWVVKMELYSWIS